MEVMVQIKVALFMDRGVLITNSKSYVPFQLVSISTTLDDLERPYRTLELIVEIWKKIDPYYQQQKYSSGL